MLFSNTRVLADRCFRAMMVIALLMHVSVRAQDSVSGDAPSMPIGSAVPLNNGNYLNEEGYRILGAGESEFDNYSETFVRDWRNADPEYEDTEFGDLMFNEASIPTKLEVLRLLSKDTPSMLVFLQAVAMGVDIEEVLQASVNYEPDKAQDLAASAVNIIPVLSDKASYLYSGYELEDLEREDEDQPYKVQEVIDRFFEQRLVLRPYPDWFEGQYHFLASARELKQLQSPEKETKWYRTKSTVDVDQRPIFVSLYEGNQAVLIDGEDRVTDALANDANALLPVVVIFNRVNERSIDQLGYSKTLRGVQQAYAQERLMLTPTPEWQLGEYHMYAQASEFYEIFDIPEESDFEPEAWLSLLQEAEEYSVTNTAFVVVVLSGGRGEEKEAEELARPTKRRDVGEQLAVWDDPRTEAEFQYVAPSNGGSLSLKNILGEGMIFNRPDLLAALNALGVSKVPVSIYYIDDDRMKPFVKGGQGLLNSVTGTLLSPSPPSSSGGITPCASPPCIGQ